jgi:bifunctional non-homologous end joining protein LigD
LVACHDAAGALVAEGQVGTGFSASTRRNLFSLLDPIRRPGPPLGMPVEAAGVRWVSPRYVGEVAYRDTCQVTGFDIRVGKAYASASHAHCRSPEQSPKGSYATRRFHNRVWCSAAG